MICGIKFAICVLIVRVCALRLTILRINICELDQIAKARNFNLAKISHYT